MEYIYAVMLLNKAGKDVSEENVSAVLKAAGVEVDLAKVKSLIAALDGVDIKQVIEESSVAMPTAISSTQGGSNDGAADSKTANAQGGKEEKKEKEVPPVADASAGLGALF